MTAYEQADQERKQLWDRKELVKSQLMDIVNPEELAKQKKRYGILEAMYEEALLRMEAARPPKDKRRKAPKQRRIALYMEGILESENACRGEAKDGAVDQMVDMDVSESKKLILVEQRKRSIVVYLLLHNSQPQLVRWYCRQNWFPFFQSFFPLHL